mmetsp:Transcript_48416/g.151825  ORF Transcript_48416/g.151825 Transcript_48416/m.151825 type:complete len:206 (-) Transcript_48416:2341-2958(-)
MSDLLSSIFSLACTISFRFLLFASGLEMRLLRLEGDSLEKEALFKPSGGEGGSHLGCCWSLTLFSSSLRKEYLPSSSWAEINASFTSWYMDSSALGMTTRRLLILRVLGLLLLARGVFLSSCGSCSWKSAGSSSGASLMSPCAMEEARVSMRSSRLPPSSASLPASSRSFRATARSTLVSTPRRGCLHSGHHAPYTILHTFMFTE